MKAKKSIPSQKFIKPSYSYLVEKKRDGIELTEDEIRFVVDSILDEEMPDAQLAALVMAIFFQGMSAQEIATLAEEVMLSGDVNDLSKMMKPKIDKYSTGGVGDKSSMALVAIAAACGVIMPHMKGDEEDFVISDVEKLKTLKGFKSDFTLKEVLNQLKKVGCILGSHNTNVAPVDHVIYELRKKTGTIPSIPLITASVLSKKLGYGSEGLIVDVKWGNGSYIKDLEQAKQLARSLTRVARSMNRRCVALVTDINQPLGDCVGTTLEIAETVKLLKGEGPEDMKELVLKLGMEIVRLAGVAGSTLSAKQAVQKVLKDGTAFEKFKEMIKAQGGDTTCIDNPDAFPKAKFIRKLPAPKRGYVHTINAGQIARGVQILAANDKDNSLDPSVGVSEIRKVGTQVKQGEPLMMIHYNDEAKLESALEYLRSAYRLAPKRPNTPELIAERVA